MISDTYDFQEFLDAMVGKDYREILVAADRECAAAESRSYGVNGAPRARKMGSTDYARSLKSFLFFLQNGVRPAGASDQEFAKYRPICEALVEKKQFKPSALDIFK